MRCCTEIIQDQACSSVQYLLKGCSHSVIPPYNFQVTSPFPQPLCYLLLHFLQSPNQIKIQHILCLWKPCANYIFTHIRQVLNKHFHILTWKGQCCQLWILTYSSSFRETQEELIFHIRTGLHEEPGCIHLFKGFILFLTICTIFSYWFA